MPHKKHLNWILFTAGIALVVLVTILYAKGDEIYNSSDPRPNGAVTPIVSKPLPSDSEVFVGAGDIASCLNDNDEATAKLLDTIQGTIFTLGDNVYQNGTEKEFEQCFAPTWGRHIGRIRPAIGNHEYHTAGAEAYFNYFASALGETDDAYYSYNLGKWHIVVLDSNCVKSGCVPNSRQYNWLKNDLLENKNTKCTLAILHHPRFSSGRIHGSQRTMEPLWQSPYDSGVDVVLSSHEHNYERFAPQTPQGAVDAVRGIRQFVVGTGGRSLYGFAKAIPNSEVRNNSTYGVLKLILQAESYSWQFLPVAGESFTDSGEGTCHQ